MQVCAVIQVHVGSNPTLTCCKSIWALERKIFHKQIDDQKYVFSIGKWENVKAYADAPSDSLNPWIL